MAKKLSYRKAQQVCNELKAEGKTIIIKIGCFDILHIGHLKMFERCKKHADILIVAVGSDAVVKELKGETYFDEKNRAMMLCAISLVDYVVILRESDHTKLLKLIKPHYYNIPVDDGQSDIKLKMIKELSITPMFDPNSMVINKDKVIEPHSGAIKKTYGKI